MVKFVFVIGFYYDFLSGTKSKIVFFGFSCFNGEKIFVCENFCRYLKVVETKCERSQLAFNINVLSGFCNLTKQNLQFSN